MGSSYRKTPYIYPSFKKFLYMQANNVTMTNTVIKSILGITPPVLLDKTGLGSFLAYLKEHDKKTLPDTAAAEATRLAPYFAAMDQRLARAAPVEKGGTQERSILTYILPRAILPYKPIDRYRPGTLKSIFDKSSLLSLYNFSRLSVNSTD